MIYKNIALVLIAVLSISVIYIAVELTIPIWLDEPLEINIKKGMSFRDAVDLLSRHGLIKDKNVFILLGKINRLERRLKPGYYSFRANINPWYVFKALRDGYVIERTVTIVEGDCLIDIKAKLSMNELIKEGEFDRLSRDRDFLQGIGITAPSLEGYLFPDTYILPKGIKPEEVVRIMVKRLREVFNDNLKRKALELGLDEREVLTLASIIEKEAVIDDERPLISAVYHNRIKKGMHLQADPTAIYGVKHQKEGILKKDLTHKTRYNTYLIKGLPPGPIASPGAKSIKASLYPSDVSYLYFVSNGDGTHTFSNSLEEHLRAVEESKIKKLMQEAGIKNGG